VVCSQPPQIRCLPYFHTWCGLSANLRCRSETCCTRLAETQDAKNSPKIAIWAPSHNFVGLYLYFLTLNDLEDIQSSQVDRPTEISYRRTAHQMRTLYFCPVVSSSSFYPFPRLFSAVAEWMSTILPHMVWPKCEFRTQV